MKGGCGRRTLGGKRKREKQMQVTQAGKLDACRKPKKIQDLFVDDCRIQRVLSSKPEER